MKKLNYLRHSLQFSTVVLLLLALSACGHKDNLLTGKYKPQLNPHPKHFFTIEGHIDKHLKQQVKLVWEVSYYSSNKKCDYVYNSFEGVNGPRISKDRYNGIIDNNGNYKVKIPMDKYREGYCKWKIATIDSTYGYSTDGFSSFIVFAQLGDCYLCVDEKTINDKNIPKIMKFDNYCILDNKKGLFCKTKSDYDEILMNYKLISNRSYKIISNYVFSEIS